LRRLICFLPILNKQVMEAFHGDECRADFLQCELNLVKEDASAMGEWAVRTSDELQRLFKASTTSTGAEGVDAAQRYGEARNRAGDEAQKLRQVVQTSRANAHQTAMRICTEFDHATERSVPACRESSPSLLDNVLRSAEADALAGLTEQEEKERQAKLLGKVYEEWSRVRHFCADGEEVFAERLCGLLAAVRAAGLIDRLDQLQPGDDAKQAALAIYRSADARQCKEVARTVRSLAQSVRRSHRAGAAHMELRDWLCDGLMIEILAGSPRWPQSVPLDLSAVALTDTDGQVERAEKTKGKNINGRMLEELQGDSSRVNWTARQWAGRLDCSVSTVQGTTAWKNILTTRKLQAADASNQRGEERRTDQRRFGKKKRSERE